jgi:hypothetical protein
MGSKYKSLHFYNICLGFQTVGVTLWCKQGLEAPFTSSNFCTLIQHMNTWHSGFMGTMEVAMSTESAETSQI